MAANPAVLVLTGSTREGSWNARLAKEAAGIAREAGASVTEVGIRELDLPLYSETLEARDGLPPGAKRLKALLLSHRGVVIASPEHNSSYPAALKNAIDWASRSDDGKGSLAAYEGRVAGLLSASPGALGGLRSLAALRTLLGNIRVLVVPEQFALVKAHEAFGPDDRLKDEAQRKQVAAVVRRVMEVATALER
jgi:NAD(P)H-dependent FMN reductase